MLDSEEDAVDIDLCHPAKILQRGFLERFYQCDAGIVDEYVKISVGLFNMLYQLAPVLFVGDIETIKFRLPAVALYTFDQVFGSLLVNIGMQHRGAGFTEQPGDRGTDAVGGTGDDCNFSLDAVDRITPSETRWWTLLKESVECGVIRSPTTAGVV